MINSNITCNSKAAAVAAMKTIARTLPKGTQKDALFAIINWIENNYPKDFDEETKQRIQKIYDDLMDEGTQKTILWATHGGEPPDGARIEVPFTFNASKKEWEFEVPPIWTEEHYLPQQDLQEDERGEE